MCSGEAEEFGLLEEPRSWLLRTGWQRRGLLSVHEMPQ
jgi:hypothetical protein